MTSINESGIKSCSSPNVYFNRISLSYGTGRSPKIDNSIDKTNLPQKSKTKSGDETYISNPLKPSYSTSIPVQANLEIYIQGVVPKKNQGSALISNNTNRMITNLVIFQSTNEELTNQIIENNLFDYSTLPILANYNNDTDYQMLETSVSTGNGNRDKVYLLHNDSTGNKIETLIKKLSFNIPKEPSHLTYFVFSKMNNSNSSRVSQRVVHSPVTIERVIENSSLIKKAFLFKDESGNIWPGPVHRHPTRGWMQGAYHVSAPHGALQKQTINNFKVGDARVLKKIEELNIDVSSPSVPDGVKYFDLFLSRKNNGTIASVINFDIKKFIIINSKFGGLINTSDAITQKEILDRSKILSFEVIRNKVKVHEGQNKIGSASEILIKTKKEAPVAIVESSDSGDRLQPKAKYSIETGGEKKFIIQSQGDTPPSNYDFFGSIQELSIENAGSSRSFSVADGSMSNITDGKYQYEVAVTVKDGAFEYLSEILTEIRSSIYGMRNYFNLASIPGNFDEETNRFLPPFIRKMSNEDSTTVAVWLGSIVNYIKTLGLITSLNPTMKGGLNREFYFMISPITGTLDGIEYFIELLEKLENKLSILISKQKPAHLEDKSSQYQTRGSQYLSIKRSFAQYVDASRMKNTGFDYIGLNKQDVGILKITRQEFSDRIGVELSRISNNLYGVDELKSQFGFIGDEEASALFSRQTDFSYIAPAYVDIFGYKTNLLQSNINLDYVSVTAAIQNLAKNPSSTTTLLLENSNIFKLLSQQGMGVTQERLSDLNNLYTQNAIANGFVFESANGELNSAQTDNLISSTDYFGVGNSFANHDSNVEQQDLTVRLPDNLPQDALSLLDRILEIDNISDSRSPLSSTPLVDVSFDLKKDNNFLNKTMRMGPSLDGVQNVNKKLSKKISELPTQIKLLTLRKNRFYDNDTGVLSTNDDSKTDGFIYNFGMIRVLEYWDSNIWKPLIEEVTLSSTSSLLCRIRKINNAPIKIGYFKLMDTLPVYDEHFLLTSSGNNGQSVPSSRPSNINSLRRDGVSYNRSSFTDGPERAYFSELNTFEAQRQEIYDQAEYTVTEPPLAPTGNRGRQPGLPAATMAATTERGPARGASAGQREVRTVTTAGGGYRGGY